MQQNGKQRPIVLSDVLQKTIFLDRDGVINQPQIINGKSYAPKTFKDFKLLSRVEEALFDLKKAGFWLFVVTNQPDVGKGIHQQSDIEAMHNFLLTHLPIDDIFTCYHTDEDQCLCRKPLPGLLMQAQKIYPVDFQNSFMIGDRWKDIDAGRAVGCKTLFIDYGYNEKQPCNMDYKVKSLLEAKNIILGANHEGN
jgi:D-glycero-D-manno-heptose 1,7-bisphosphate phosphatase